MIEKYSKLKKGDYIIFTESVYTSFYTIGERYLIEFIGVNDWCVVTDDRGTPHDFGICSDFMIKQFEVEDKVKIRKEKLKTIL